MPSLRIALKRAYESPSDDDGLRILVERLWPRGVSKADAAIDHWAKDVVPTPQLRTWFGHRPERWAVFRQRYRDELIENVLRVDSLKKLCAGRRVTFVFAAKDVEQNGATVLRKLLLHEEQSGSKP